MRLSEATIAISGLGLMGGSLGMALRGKCLQVVGVARRAEVCEEAVRMGAVDQATCDLSGAVASADIVVLATPVRHIIESIPVTAEAMRPGALLIDLGSTKRQIVAAMNTIPEGLRAVGGHPMCGKETGGIESIESGLFSGARFVLSPTLRSTGEALGLASKLAEAVGALPMLLEAERHDRAVAMTSHLAYLLSASLVHAVGEAYARDESVGALAASGFRDTTRLAASQVDMMLDIVLTNSDAVELALDALERQLAGVRAHIKRRPDALRLWMAEAQSHRKKLCS